MRERHCSNCGELVGGGSQFCGACGLPTKAEGSEERKLKFGSPRSLIAGTVAIVIGAAGVGTYFYQRDSTDSPRPDVAVISSPSQTANGEASPPPAPEPAPTASCVEVDPPTLNSQQYQEPPLLDLPEGVDYSAVINTTCGQIAMDLLEVEAEKSVSNFIFLAREGFYNGITWHRVEQDQVIQTGDPDGQNGSAVDGPGYVIPDEFPESANEYLYGVVGMANGGPGTGGSQFFIVVHDPSREEPAGYPPLYSIFAEVESESYPVLQEIQKQPTRGGQDPVESVQPVNPIYITSVDIIEN